MYITAYSQPARRPRTEISMSRRDEACEELGDKCVRCSLILIAGLGWAPAVARIDK